MIKHKRIKFVTSKIEEQHQWRERESKNNSKLKNRGSEFEWNGLGSGGRNEPLYRPA